MVPAEEACVQPKTRTAQVGCTLRSFSHHLALLPAVGHVATTWLLGVDTGDFDSITLPSTHVINLLFVPFPYNIPAQAFRPAGYCLNGSDDDPAAPLRRRWRYFDLAQDWLRAGKKPLTAQALADFLQKLVEEAEQTVDRVHGVVLPELALNDQLAADTAELLARGTRLELFISGIAAAPDQGRPSPAIARTPPSSPETRSTPTGTRASTTAGSSNPARSAATTWPTASTPKATGGNRSTSPTVNVPSTSSATA